MHYGKTLILSFVLVYASCVDAQAEQPALEEGVKIEAGGTAIDVQLGDLVPAVVDWDCDGKKDLVAGQYKDGKIRFYRNTGEDAAPKFEGFVFLKAGGFEITLPYC